ncbi:hypothetical protein SAMN05216386_2406 [Nitrosospira briensis]|uniref:Uncharacterized protein n=1 Tax=Nitrosospira briensis TaxID=35799 RepID=A0A1I5DUP5_9PROT|nr:hypothetical protein SAMN05216386_2406 [Nitrosospira briensis]
MPFSYINRGHISWVYIGIKNLFLGSHFSNVNPSLSKRYAFVVMPPISLLFRAISMPRFALI